MEANLQALNNDDVSVVTADMDDDNVTIATTVDAAAEEDAQRANTTWDNTVGEGEKFRYNYNLYADVISGFVQGQFKYNKIDFYA